VCLIDLVVDLEDDDVLQALLTGRHLLLEMIQLYFDFQFEIDYKLLNEYLFLLLQQYEYHQFGLQVQYEHEGG
jgi:hypothetical protein